jgi:hypothetical protein
MNELAPVLAVLVFFCAIAYITRTYLNHSRDKRESEARQQLHSRLIDKFGTTSELIEYLQSEAGRKFLTPEVVERITPYKRILAAAQVGIVFTFVGLGVLWFRSLAPAMSADSDIAFLFLGAVTLALGLGFLASSTLAFVLSRSWGLFNGKHNGSKTSE